MAVYLKRVLVTFTALQTISMLGILCGIYKATLLLSVITLFGQDKYKWVLQEDNNPKHMSRKSHKWRADNQITHLP